MSVNRSESHALAIYCLQNSSSHKAGLCPAQDALELIGLSFPRLLIRQNASSRERVVTRTCRHQERILKLA